MSAKKKKKQCTQKGLCPFYGNCKYSHDMSKCRVALVYGDEEVVEIA